MNRPHVAALLRAIADEAAMAGRLLTVPGEPVVKAEAERLISRLVGQLRVRAGEIEAGQN